MNDRIHKEYGKLSAADLRFLLSMQTMLEDEEAELNREVLSNPAKNKMIFAEDAPQFVWVNYYELDFPLCVLSIIGQLGVADEIVAICKDKDPVQALSGWVEKQKTGDLDDDLTQERWLHIARTFWPMGVVLSRNIKSLMVYGLYINDLVKIAREGKLAKRDQALLNAIRIDPAVIGCKTSVERISRAVLMQDAEFMSGLCRALEGKLGTREQANYKKMRLVLQALLDVDALQLSDQQLVELFIKQLNLYSDVASAEHNLSEFARNFKKKKSTI